MAGGLDLNSSFVDSEETAQYPDMSELNTKKAEKIEDIEEIEEELPLLHRKIKESDVIIIDESDIDDVEGAPYQRKEPGKQKRGAVVDYASVPEDMLFGTEYVAAVLGVSTQAVRNYTNDYEEYLQIRKRPKGQRRFTHEDIAKLQQLLKVKDENNFTTEQMKEYLKNPHKLELVPEDKKLEAVLDIIQKNMVENMRTMLAEVMENSTLLLKEKETENQENINLLTEQMKKQDSAIGEMLELLKTRDQESEIKSEEQISKLMKMIDEKNDTIEQLLASAKEKDKIIEGLEKKSKKKFFGLIG